MDTSLRDVPPRATRGAAAGRSCLLLGAGVALGIDRVPAGRTGRRAAPRPDEDAVTLAVEAAAKALPAELTHVAAIIFASISGPYELGGSGQLVAELLGLQGEVFTLDLAASPRDGLAAIRLAGALAAGSGPVLVCAAHADPTDARSGGGAVALLVGDPDDAGPGLATLTPAAGATLELRDSWRPRGDFVRHEADRSFVQSIATDRLSRDLLEHVPDALSAPVVVVGPDSATSAQLSRAWGAPEDEVTRHTGVIGSAHPLLRLLAGLDQPQLIVSVSNGLAEAVHVAPAAGASALAASVRREAQEGGAEAARAMHSPVPADFDPFSSGPRSWRDRDVDLRLDGLLGEAAATALVPGRAAPMGTVIALTRDHLYPGADVTEMTTLRMDTGGQFYGQVSMGEHVAMGDRVELVPRRLHQGGGVIQYFWKVRPCQ